MKLRPGLTRKGDWIDLNLGANGQLIGKFIKETADSIHLHVKIHKRHILGIHNYETKETVRFQEGEQNGQQEETTSGD